MKNNRAVKKTIETAYARMAKAPVCGCGNQKAQRQSGEMGYSEKEMDQVPAGSNMGLGCGNPVAIASLKPGEVVLDLGSGAGFDVFLAARKVGKTGKVIGGDMTDEMLVKAKDNASKGGFSNTEFRKGDIEDLPVSDNEVDVVISNCVINLAPDKKKVFREIFRVLKPGGRVMVSDVVLTKPLPKKIKNDEELLSGCVSGAILKDDYLELLRKVGFSGIEIYKENEGFLKNFTVSMTYLARKAK